MGLFAFNSYDKETTSTDIPSSNVQHLRSSSAESDCEMLSPPTSPTSPTSPNTPISPSNVNNSTLNNNRVNLQRRASESIPETIQFKRLPMRRKTLPSI